MASSKKTRISLPVCISIGVVVLLLGIVALAVPGKLASAAATMFCVLLFGFLPWVVSFVTGYEHMSQVRSDAEALSARLRASENQTVQRSTGVPEASAYEATAPRSEDDPRRERDPWTLHTRPSKSIRVNHI